MASALQKLFRKRISKHQIQEQRQKEQVATLAPKTESRPKQNKTSNQPYLTVSSLNSPSSSTSHFPYSSRLSLDLYATVGSAAGLESASPQDRRTSREEYFSKSSHQDGRPRASTVNSYAMSRKYSGGSNRGWRTSSFTDGDPQMDQFGSYLSSADRDTSIQTHGHEEGDEEDVDLNTMYLALSQKEELKHDWNAAKLVLIPSKQQQRKIERRELENDGYLALHTLLPSNLFKDQYVSVRSTIATRKLHSGTDPWSDVVVTATLEAESHSVHILVSRSSGGSGNAIREEHRATVLGETTVYRSSVSSSSDSFAVQHSEESSPSSRPRLRPSAKIRKERVQIRVLTIDDLVISDELISLLYPIETSSAGCATDKASQQGVLVEMSSQDSIDTGDAIAFPKSSPSSSPASPEIGVPEDVCLIPLRRQFLADLAFLLDPPPELEEFKRPLQQALATLVRAANEFTDAYVYVPGFDAYNVSRIRRGILSKSWQAFDSCEWNDKEAASPGWPVAKLGQEGRARLLLLLENVVLGYCHGKLYTSIRAVYRDSDEVVDNVIYTYHELEITLDDLGVGIPAICRRPDLLDRAIFIMKHLGDADEDMEHLFQGGNDLAVIRALAKQGDPSQQINRLLSKLNYTPETNRSRLRTPLDVLDVLHATLEEIVSAISTTQSVGSKGALGMDELLPILAYVMVRAGPLKLASLLYYTRYFGLSDAVSSKLSWALTTHDAVIEYLCKDPLRLCYTTRSSSSSLRAQSPPCNTPRTPTFRFDSASGGIPMEPNLSSESLQRRRRCSLPGDAVLSSTTDPSVADTISSLKSSQKSPDQTCSAESHDSDSKGTLEESSVFKVPGRPASSYGGFPRTRVMSALDVVGEDGAVSDSGRESPSLTSRPTIYRGSSTSRRTNSMSSSTDLLIRPQIVVRPKRNPNRVVAGSDARYLSKERVKARDMERNLNVGSATMIRAESEDVGASRKEPSSTLGHSSITGAVQAIPRQIRRKSLDSWSAFSFFGGGNMSPTTEDSSSRATSRSTTTATTTTTTTTGMSPSGSSHGIAAPFSPPVAWLSSWTSDWGRKDSIAAQSPGAGSSSSDVDCRPEHAPSSNQSSFPSTSSLDNNSALDMNSSTLPSLLLHHDSSLTISDIASNSSNHAKKPASIRSTSSSSQSAHHHQHHSRASELHSPPAERRFKSSRSRLLSITNPLEPLPPQLYPETAAANYFQVTSPANKDGHYNSYQMSKVLVGSSSFTTSSEIRDAPWSQADQLTPRTFTSFDGNGNSLGYFSTPVNTNLGKPSPFDKSADPMATANRS
ncbi:hypothetical protein CBS101457_001813 [Exobasidium rhododendri]|nr:hypothetical protein CBS101457_001813 [Exobasidium rhododendri]